MKTSTDAVVLHVPGRFRIVGLVMIAVTVTGIAVVAAVIWRAGFSTAYMAIPVLMLVLPLWTALPNTFGNRATHIDADGVLTRVYPWDRRPVLVYLEGDAEPALAAVEWFSRETVPVLDGRPDEPRPEPAPVPHQVYRASARNLVLPAALG